MTTADQDRLGTALVGAQMVLLTVLALPGRRRTRRPPRPARVVGSALLGAGVGTALAGAAALGPDLRPAPRPRHGATLRTEGMYAHVRHPIYTGLLLGAAGRALASGRAHHRWAAAILGVLLTAKSGYEETHLCRAFPGYPAYAARTPRLVPRPARPER